MPFPPRPIDATLHGVTDYAVGTTLLTVFPRLADINGTESARQVRVAGAIHAGYSTLTDYPLGAVKAIPFKVHLALDAAGVTKVLDIRQRRGVRGARYSWANAQRLQALLAAARIGYEHHPELAPDTQLRQLQYREDDRQGVGKRSRVRLAPEYIRT